MPDKKHVAFPGRLVIVGFGSIGQGSLSTSAGVTKATFTTAILTVGTHSITASYNGDSSFAPSNGSLMNGQSVIKAGTSTALSSSVSASVSQLQATSENMVSSTSSSSVAADR